MKRIFYFLKEYKYDFLVALLTVAIVIVAFIFFEDRFDILLVSSAVIILFLAVVIYLHSKDKDFYFISLTKRENKDNWIGKGNFDYSRTNKCFSLTNADPGYIYSKCLNWSDYNLSFDFKMISDCVGVIVRAVNLSNYLMLQIREDVIRPHIRINGEWRVWEPRMTNLTFEKKLSLDKWYKCLIYCEKDCINIRIFDGKVKIFDREWNIPKGKIVFEFEGRDSFKSGKYREILAPEKKKDIKVHIPLSINLEYGSVGFRNWDYEKALIKNLLVEKN